MLTPGAAGSVQPSSGAVSPSVSGSVVPPASVGGVVGAPGSVEPKNPSVSGGGNGLPTGGGADGFEMQPNEDGGNDVGIWNQEQKKYQRVRLTGAAGNEVVTVVD